MFKPIFILELNEFNDELLRQAAKDHWLPNLEKVLTLKRSLYKTDDRYNTGYLEPWVQWASIHTGISAKQHQVKNKGEMPIEFQPIWEKIGNENITSIVWGVINASISKHENVISFVPEKIYSHDFSKWRAKWHAAKIFFDFLFKKQGAQLALAKQRLHDAINQFGHQSFVYNAYYEHCDVLKILNIIHLKKPHVVFLGLNLLSYLEHHFWKKADAEISPEMLFGLKHLNTVFGLIFENLSNLTFVMHNGLSQLSTHQEKSTFYYKHKNLYQFLIDMRIRFVDLIQDDTAFWQMNFSCVEHRDEAYNIFYSAKFERKPLFKVERSASELKIFVRLNLIDDISESATFELAAQQYLFSKYFEKNAVVTGRRVPMGTIYSNEIEFPDHIFNHDFNRYLLNFLKPAEYPLPKRELTLNFDINTCR